MTAVGHDYLPLPSTPDEWIRNLAMMKPLNDIQLVDVIHNFCSVKGLVGEIFHRLKGEVRQLIGMQGLLEATEEIEYLIEQRFAEISDLVKPYGEALREVEFIRNRLSPISHKNISIFLATEEAQILSLLPGDNGELLQLIEKNPKFWSVLILDDEPESLSNVVVVLKKRGIQKIHFAKSVPEAKNIIQKDILEGNRITVVFLILDYLIKKIKCLEV